MIAKVSPSDQPPGPTLELLSKLCSAALVALGSLVLVGWAFDIPLLIRVSPTFATMKANTALLFVTFGVSLWFSRKRSARIACAALIVLISGPTLLEHLTQISFGIDELLFRDHLSKAAPGRMAPATAITFFLLGWSTLPIVGQNWRRLGDVAAVLAATVTLVAICGYLYGASSLYAIAPYSSIALHTAVGFMIACCGVFASRPNRGMAAALVGDTAAGELLRKFLPVLAAIPLLLGWFALAGLRESNYDAPFAIAILVVGNIWILTAAIWIIGFKLHSSELKRRQSEAKVTAKEKDLETTLRSIGDAVITTDAKGLVTRMNPAAEQLTGWKESEALGQALHRVFHILNEDTLAIVESPVDRVLRDGRIVSLANHTLLVARDGTRRPIANSGAPIRDTDSNEVRGVVLVFRDMWADHAAEELLKQSEQRYRDLYENSPDMYASVAIDGGTILDSNHTTTHKLGFLKTELVGKPLGDIHDPSSLAAVQDVLAAVKAGFEVHDVELALRRKDGSPLEVSLNVSSIASTEGTPAYSRFVWRDISARKQAERDQALLLDISDLLRTGTDVSTVLFEVSERLGRYLKVDRCSFAEIDEQRRTVTIHRDFHGTLHSIAGTQPLPEFSSVTQEELRAGRTIVLEDSSQDPRTSHGYSAYTRLKLVGVIVTPLHRDDKWVASVCISSETPRKWQDREVALVRLVAERTWLWIEHLSSRKHAERERASLLASLQTLNSQLEERVQARTVELSASLKERDVLLQEVHHRVKNNLQVISSLINMQMRQLRDEASKESLAECSARISAIALIHEKLYQTSDYARVPFSDYVSSLATNVFHASGISSQHVNLDLHVEPVSLAVDKAIPCGLVLNELMSNALKHAFPGDRAGTVKVELKKVTSRELLLAVGDDGIGMGTPSAGSVRPGSLGMQLVSTLVEQLEGRLEVSNGKGTAFKIVFPMSSV